MKLMTYTHPMSAFDSLFGGDPFENLAPLFDFSRMRNSNTAAEWFEDDENYYSRVEMPGIAKDDLALELEADLVTLYFKTGETDSENQPVQIERKLRIPEGIDASNVTASLEDGILTLSMPKMPTRKTTTIEIA